MNKAFISVIGGLAGMLGWGTSDFFANIGSDKIGHNKTFFWSQVVGLAAVGILFALIRPAVSISPFLFLILGLGGVVYAIGYLFFYTAFEIGNVSIVSAVVNLYAVFTVLISYFVRGQNLTVFQLLGIIVILVGVTLVSVNFNDVKNGSMSLSKGVKETIIAASLFGILFWPSNEFVVEKVDWLFVTMMTKVFAVGTVLALSMYKRHSLQVSLKNNLPVLLTLAAVGLLEVIAVLGVNFGMALGDGIIVIPISSALTVVTVSLAVIFLKEKLSSLQTLGILLTVGGIVLTAF